MGSFQDSYNSENAKKVCSDITLFNPKQGFFANFIDQVLKNVPTPVFNLFSQLRLDKDRLKALWELEVVHTLTIHPLFTGKRGDTSDERRQNGNEAFKAANNQKALAFYTQAVIRAPWENGDTRLSLALANRSAALFRMGEFETCLQDIDLALQEGYPENLRYKVVERRAQCYLKLGRFKEAKKSLKQCLQLLKSSNLDEQRIEQWTKDVREKLQQKYESDDASINTVHRDDSDVFEELLYNGASKTLPKASSAVAMQYTKESGRYISCSSPIPGGSLLFREEPFCSVLMPDKHGLCCCHCYKKLIAPVPCRTCCNTAFCSVSCRSEADRTYHKYECEFAELLRGSGMSLNCYLSLRAVTERGLKKLKNASLPTQDEGSFIPTVDNPYDGRNVNNVLRLVALEERRDHVDFFQRTLMAIFLLKVLKKANFFAKKEKEGRPLLEDHIIVGSILLRMLQVAQFNSHELSAISYRGEPCFKESKSVYLGLALYPTVSFLNHSCYPAVGRYFNGKEMSIVTLRPLKKGEIVSENYGPIFTHHDWQDRQRKLKSRYWFDCQCDACRGNWPLLEYIPSDPILACDLCRSQVKKMRNVNGFKPHGEKEEGDNVKNGSDEKCSKCGTCDDPLNTMEKISIAHREFVKGKEDMDSYRREDAIQSYLNYVEEVSPKCQLPIRDFHIALQALRHLLFHRGKTAIFSSNSDKGILN